MSDPLLNYRLFLDGQSSGYMQLGYIQPQPAQPVVHVTLRTPSDSYAIDACASVTLRVFANETASTYTSISIDPAAFTVSGQGYYTFDDTTSADVAGFSNSFTDVELLCGDQIKGYASFTYSPNGTLFTQNCPDSETFPYTQSVALTTLKFNTGYGTITGSLTTASFFNQSFSVFVNNDNIALNNVIYYLAQKTFDSITGLASSSYILNDATLNRLIQSVPLTETTAYNGQETIVPLVGLGDSRTCSSNVCDVYSSYSPCKQLDSQTWYYVTSADAQSMQKSCSVDVDNNGNIEQYFVGKWFDGFYSDGLTLVGANSAPLNNNASQLVSLTLTASNAVATPLTNKETWPNGSGVAFASLTDSWGCSLSYQFLTELPTDAAYTALAFECMSTYTNQLSLSTNELTLSIYSSDFAVPVTLVSENATPNPLALLAGNMARYAGPVPVTSATALGYTTEDAQAAFNSNNYSLTLMGSTSNGMFEIPVAIDNEGPTPPPPAPSGSNLGVQFAWTFGAYGAVMLLAVILAYILNR
jgi:hypothetical protein